MFVHAAARGDESLEVPEGRRHESRLPIQPLGAAIDVDAALQTLRHEPIEVRDRSTSPAKLVVEREDLDDEPWPHPERRRISAGRSRIGRPGQEHLALERGEQRGPIGKGFVQPRVEHRRA